VAILRFGRDDLLERIKPRAFDASQNRLATALFCTDMDLPSPER
jgi:hypothetical protein